jgi:type VI secretion system secreted protein Hcp
MAVDAFIWFKPALGAMPTPKGESKDSVYGKEGKLPDTPAFEIKDFSFGIENPTTVGSATGGAGAGKIKFNEFTIKKTSDLASPDFFRNCCAGAHYDEVIVEMRKAGGEALLSGGAFMRFKFKTVFTTKIDWSGPGDEGPEESITFVYGQLGVKYWGQTEKGEQLGGETFSGWDQVKNKDFVALIQGDKPVGK